MPPNVIVPRMNPSPTTDWNTPFDVKIVCVTLNPMFPTIVTKALRGMSLPSSRSFFA